MKQLMTHIVAGYPSLEESAAIAKTMIDQHVQYLEIQIPFSDPIADGPTIMGANQAALANGTKPTDCFKMLAEMVEYARSQNSPTKLLFMTYYNIIFNYGVTQFCQEAATIGAYGIICPDIPPQAEEHEHFLKNCQENNLHAIQIIAPHTTNERLREINKVASGFVYCVARKGTTGTSNNLNGNLPEYLTRVREHIDVPLAVGFGISTPEQVREVLEKADLAVMGSKFIKLHQEGGVLAVREFLDRV